MDFTDKPHSHNIRKVVYTALTGSYDALEQHEYVEPGWDYICFSNDFGDKKKVGIWQIRHIDFDTDEKQLQSRFPKLQPHKVLPEYDYSLYVDANVNIQDDYVFRRIDELLAKGVLLAGVKHQLRDCLYEEGFQVIYHGMDKNKEAVKRQLSLYKKEGFPQHFGMYEANVIFRQQNNPQVVKQSDLWWYLRCHYSKRDQLGFSYSLWKVGLPFVYLLPENEWARNSSHITCAKRPWKYPYLIQRTVNVYHKYIVPLIMKVYYKTFYKKL